MTEDRRPSGWRHGNLPQALEAAALELVVERGARGFSLAEASRRAGVSVAAPYRHYADRDALLAALAVRAYQAQEDRFRRAVASQVDPEAQLAAFALAYLRFAVEEPALFDILFDAGLDKARYPAVEEAGARVLAVLQEPVRALGVEGPEGEVLVVQVAAVAHGFARFLRDGVLGTGSAALQRADRDLTAVVAHHVRTLLER